MLDDSRKAGIMNQKQTVRAAVLKHKVIQIDLSLFLRVCSSTLALISDKRKSNAQPVHNSVVLSRKAFAITETELNVMAALAIIGLKSIPKKGYKTPAAMGTPTTL